MSRDDGLVVLLANCSYLPFTRIGDDMHQGLDGMHVHVVCTYS